MTKPLGDAYTARHTLYQAINRLPLKRLVCIPLSLPTCINATDCYYHHECNQAGITPVLYHRPKQSRVAHTYFGAALTYCSNTDTPSVMASVDQCLRDYPDAVIVGGLMFPTARDISCWAPFYKAHFWVPRFRLSQCNQSQTVTGTAWLWLDHDADRESLILFYQQLLDGLRQTPPVSNNREKQQIQRHIMIAPDHAHFCQLVSDTVSYLQQDPVFSKVVLATQGTTALPPGYSTGQLFQALCAQEPDSHHVLWQQTTDDAFMCVSPERLLHRQGNTLSIDIIAGTRPRGDTAAETDRYAADLRHATKDLHEHAIVYKYSRNKLLNFCQSIQPATAPIVIQQSRVQHLYQCINATMQSTHDPNCTCINHLFPTPAVAGDPLDRAIAYIDNHEPLIRGLYSGVIGQLSATESDYIVGIRAIRQSGHQLTLYTGSGIVGGSVPDDEWQEHAIKRRSLHDAVGL